MNSLIKPSSGKLTVEETEQLEGCEQIIENGLNIWYQVGEALLHIRDNKLYRATHKTFETYCQERWDMSRPRAYQLIGASEAYQNLSTIVDIPESQVRPLTPLAPDEQRLVWDVVQQTAPAGKVTAEHVKSVVSVLKEVTATGAIDNGEGESIPAAQATVQHIKAAVTEETYERQRRQEAHIAEKQGGVPAALQSSESNEWYTPRAYLDGVRTVLGHVDIDPASNAEANKIVQASIFYDIHDDGLSHDWTGKVFLNPPYGRDGISNQERWSHRLIAQYKAGITTEAILLVNAVTDRAWFQPLWDFPICFTDHRVPFYRPGGQPGAQPVIGSAFIYFGNNPTGFANVFRRFGAVVMSVIREVDDASDSL